MVTPVILFSMGDSTIKRGEHLLSKGMYIATHQRSPRSFHASPCRILTRWRREREEREQCGCFTRQLPYRLNLGLQISHQCTSCCHTTHNISFFVQIMKLILIMRLFIRQFIVCIIYYIVSR